MARNKASSKKPSSTPRKPKPTGPPAPFTSPPKALLPFLETLSPSHIYIVHIDTFPADFKKRIFYVPILLNISIVILLAYRIYAAAPFYFSILLSTLGNKTASTIDVGNTSWPDLLWIIFSRAAIFLTDFILFRFIGPWPLEFFFAEPGNPAQWKWKVGFRDQEIVVRVSRLSWDSELTSSWMEEGEETDEDGERSGEIFRDRIMPAIDPQYVREKTGYVMMDKSWDLNFAAMIKAHEMVDTKKAAIDDFQKAVIAHHDAHGWLVWNLHKLDEGASDARRQNFMQMQQKLEEMGKQNLFYRWVELIQYESTRPGGFTPERQKVALEEVKKLFKKHGVDFEKFSQEVGHGDLAASSP
ncbi:MAG: hypothetical protein M1834_002761 [Cirrosporium novae-zelandiae]|nr:MAG: hypothetical protein M1834_002761 [Cirrosporium novae-zelandiae]